MTLGVREFGGQSGMLGNIFPSCYVGKDAAEIKFV